MRAASKARSHIPPARSKGRASTAAITAGLTPCHCSCSTVMLPRPSCAHWAPSRGCFLVRLRSNMKNTHRVDFVEVDAPRGLSVISCFCSPAAWLLLLRFIHPSHFRPSQLIFSPFPPSPPSLLPSFRPPLFFSPRCYCRQQSHNHTSIISRVAPCFLSSSPPTLPCTPPLFQDNIAHIDAHLHALLDHSVVKL
jgi:hypothetical protein